MNVSGPFLLLFSFSLCVSAAGPDDYALVRGGFLPGHTDVVVDDFEMQVRPVTNAEYRAFVDATGRAAPLHWEDGEFPSDWASHPVIFVNRFDAVAYAEWLTKQEGRVYRLPTRTEFEYASRAGDDNAKYPWGSDLPGEVNWDSSGERTFAQWRQYLQPVGQTPPNALGLRDLAGNVWQMVDTYPDLAVSRWIYRVADINAREGDLGGGSWARAEYYLRCGVFGRASAGIRHPDIGFRLVREPQNTTHFHTRVRRVLAMPNGRGSVYLGWQLLPSDNDTTGFHVYRSPLRDAAGVRITETPIIDSTNYVDTEPPQGKRIYYRVRPVDDGTQGRPSEWAGVEAGAQTGAELMRIEPTVRTGGFVSVFGDLDGDGRLDAVLRLDNGIREMSRDPGVPVELEAFTSYGRSLWRRPLVNHDHCFGSANNVPINVFDLDGDGRAEVIARLQEADTVYLAVLDGMTGRVLRKTPWTEMVSDYARSSTRIHMSVAYLDGQTPAIVIQTGLYENEVVDAFDAGLNHLWRYESFAETNGSGSHHIDIADLDGDGRDEVLVGTTALNPDGTLRWSIYREHPDIVAVNRFLPDRPGRQVYYAVESSVHAGAYLVDADTGAIIWKLNREDDPRWHHAHTGWAADIWDGASGIEMMTNRDGHPQNENVLFAADGRILADPFARGWRPVNWTGGQIRELMDGTGTKLGRFNGSGVSPIESSAPSASASGSCRMVADLAGDFRDEVVCSSTTPEGAPVLLVFTNTTPIDRRELTRTSSRGYRLWLAHNMGGGYPSYFEWQAEE